MYQIMTPGPVQVRENVRLARSRTCTNPDIDPDFYDFYRETCGLLEKALHGEDYQALILGGEGILGLEAACASLTEPGDRVLVIDNGVFGRGFADFVKIYGGEPVLFTTDYHSPVPLDKLDSFLRRDHNFKYATFVHVDTPSGMLNDVATISGLIHRYGILCVADSVAGMFGQPLDLSRSKIDILCGGSQKALSAPPGLTMLWVSEDAFRAMEQRKTPVASFYASIPAMKNYYKEQWFPYTMPVSDINGLRQAVDNFLADDGVLARHALVAKATRRAILEAGLTLYPVEGANANTVSAINVPEGITDREILSGMCRQFHIMIAGSFDTLAGKVIRIGHMGENCYPEKVAPTLFALQRVLEEHGISLSCDMENVFWNAVRRPEN